MRYTPTPKPDPNPIITTSPSLAEALPLNPVGSSKNGVHSWCHVAKQQEPPPPSVSLSLSLRL